MSADLGREALSKLLNDPRYAFTTVLDIGCGAGHHSEVLRQAGKEVTAIDYRPRYSQAIDGDFMTYQFGRLFDCVWCCHVLEHQFDPHKFLLKIVKVLSPNGVLAITVPPRNDLIAGGHLSLWTPWLLLYHLVLAGLDCSEARLGVYGYNISVIVRKVPNGVSTQELTFSRFDIPKLRPFLPKGQKWVQHENGNVRNHNW